MLVKKSEEWWIKHEQQSRRLQDCMEPREKWELLKRAPDLVSFCTFTLDYLDPNTPDSVPNGVNEVRDYVACESASLSAESLSWIRTANIGGVHYWLWEMGDYDDSYVYVELSRNCGSMGLLNKRDLSPEQFLARVYLSEYADVD
jgi:hypothetical protein